MKAADKTVRKKARVLLDALPIMLRHGCSEIDVTWVNRAGLASCQSATALCFLVTSNLKWVSIRQMSIRPLQFCCEATSKSCTVKTGFKISATQCWAGHLNGRNNYIVKAKSTACHLYWIRYFMQFCFKI
jgi:hypothetical protein